MTRSKENKQPNLLGFSPAFWGLVALLAAVLGSVTWFGMYAKVPVSRLVSLSFLAHALYGAALLAAWKSKGKLKSVWVVLIVSLVLRIIMVPSPPVFSDDIYRYIWDGQTLISGDNPYAFSPAEAEAPAANDPIWSKINHPEFRTIYPPFAELIFGAIAFISPTLIAFKAASVLADCTNVLLVLLLAGASLPFTKNARGRNVSNKAILAGLAYGLNPLVCMESGMSGHLDPFGVMTALIAVLLLKKGQSLWAAALLGLGTGIKLIPATLLPMTKPKRILAVLIFTVVLLGLYLPFISVGESTVETMDAFARRWEGNGGAFVLCQKSFKGIIGSLAGVSSDNEMIHIRFLDPIAHALQGTFFSLHKLGGYDPEAPGKFTLGDLSLALTKLMIGIVFVAVIIITTIKRIEPIRATAWIFGTVLVATPVLHPWYLLWILPFAAILGLWPWMVLGAFSVLAYLPLGLFWSNGIWSVPSWIPIVEYGVFTMACTLYLAKRWDSTT